MPFKQRPNPMPQISYELIESQESLVRFCEVIAQSEILAVDTEFVGEKTYYPTLELIQVGDGRGNIGLVDVRQCGDMAPLAEILCSANRTKIFHAATQDISILERSLGKPPEPLFDTQLAAAMVGIGAQVSYANLVQELLSKTVDKAQMVSDWSQRPLKRAQLDYAASDVLHLHSIRTILQHKLEELGRQDWFTEEQRRRVEDARQNDTAPESELYTNVKEWGKLSGQRLAILQQLAIWREREAKSQNVPRRTIMPDAGLVGLARLAPSNRDDVRNVRQLPQGAVYRYIDQVLPIIAEAKKIPRDQWPKKTTSQRPDIPNGFVELLQALVRATAEQEKIASSLLTTTSELNALVNQRGRLDDGLKLPVLNGWRREMIGERLIALLQGKVRLRIEDGERLVFEDH